MAAKDQEHFHSSMRIKDKAITDLERKLVDSHARLQNLLLKEGWLQSKVRQGNPMKEAACAHLCVLIWVFLRGKLLVQI